MVDDLHMHVYSNLPNTKAEILVCLSVMCLTIRSFISASMCFLQNTAQDALRQTTEISPINEAIRK
jgi:hypothetical protein